MKEENGPLSHDETISDQFLRIENRLANYKNPIELLEGYIADIGDSFNIPYVWLTLIASPSENQLIEAACKSPFLSERLNIVERNIFTGIAGPSMTPLLANVNLKPLYALLPRKNKYFLRSICIAPFGCQRRVIGSFNHADYCPHRYQSDMDYSLLARLMQSVTGRLTEFAGAGE